MSEVWSLPGYDVQCLLGFGATGEVWRAREQATGDVVALKRLRPGVDPAAVQALRREASVLASLETPHVVRLRAVVGAGADAVLVLDHAAGGSLASLLARRGVLDAGEVITVAAPLAQALATAHERGLVHGDVTPANILFTADGMPLLSDLGLARVAGEALAQVDGTAEFVDPAVAAGAEPGPAADVWALAAVCHTMLAGSPPHGGTSVTDVLDAARAGERAPLGLLAPAVPRALVHAVEAALSVDPAARPDAAAFASSLRRAHAVAPVRLTAAHAPGAAPPTRPTHVVRPAAAHAAPRRTPRLSSRQGLAAGLVLLVLLAAIAGWASGRNAVPPAAALPRAAPATTAPVDWAAVLDGLDAARARAFAEGNAAALPAVWADGSPGLSDDRRRLAALTAQGRTAHGLRRELRSVQEVTRADATARLRVADVLGGYEVRGRDGAVLQQAPARGERRWLVELVRTSAGWRLVRLSPRP